MSVLPRRILKETQRLMQEPVPGISAQPDEGNARYLPTNDTRSITRSGRLDVRITTIIVLFCFSTGIFTSKSPVPKTLRSKVDCSSWNCFYPKTIPCPHPKFGSSRKFTIQTSIDSAEFVWTYSRTSGRRRCRFAPFFCRYRRC